MLWNYLIYELYKTGLPILWDSCIQYEVPVEATNPLSRSGLNFPIPSLESLVFIPSRKPVYGYAGTVILAKRTT
jgi:hypothetical protein